MLGVALKQQLNSSPSTLLFPNLRLKSKLQAKINSLINKIKWLKFGNIFCKTLFKHDYIF